MKTPPNILFILLAAVIIISPTTTAAAYSSYLPQSPPQQPPPPPPPPPATASLPAPTTTTTSSPPPPATPTSSLPPSETPKSAPPSGSIPSILSTLGYHDLSTIDTTIAFPVTIFAPTDSSVRTCSSCSVRRLLLEHSIPGLYPLPLLRMLAFGTKIETLASSPTPLCLTLTKSRTNALGPTLFVNGVKITRPEVFNDGKVIVHGIQGFLAHLSPLSCQIERMTTLSFPSQPYSGMQAFIMRFLLKDALLRLRISGYSVLSLAMQEKFQELMNFNNMTVFALDDDAVFGDGHVYLSDLSFHIVPNQRIMAVDLLNLPAGTVLPTNERREKLVVTVAGGGGLLTPMRINNVKIIRTDVVVNDGVVVHRVATPFPRVHRAGTAFWPDQMDDTDQTAEMK